MGEVYCGVVVIGHMGLVTWAQTPPVTEAELVHAGTKDRIFHQAQVAREQDGDGV
jgi:hypothetical protein